MKHSHLPARFDFLLLAGGPLVLLPYIIGHKAGKATAGLLLLSVLPYVVIPFLSFHWVFIFSSISVYNFIFFLFFLGANRPIRPNADKAPAIQSLKNWFTITGLALPVSVLYAAIERWVSDTFWSSLVEVNFSPDHISQGYYNSMVTYWLFVAVVSILPCLYFKSLSIQKTLFFLMVCAAGSLVVTQLNFLLIDIPQRHALLVKSFPQWVSIWRGKIIYLVVLLGFSFLFGELAAFNDGFKQRAVTYLRGFTGICLALFSMSIISGMPVEYALLTGKQYEKYAYTQKAITWYGKTLNWMHSDDLKSYIQFHIGLLYRKNGRNLEAREAFSRVLLKYNSNPEIVHKATKFHRRLRDWDEGAGQRFVIPGVETRTEYKAAYCVPNSLGLVLNYWGDAVGAKSIGASITKLAYGSYMSDEAFYTEDRGLNHWVLPFCSHNTLRQLISNNIPVLAFIPGHVISIFGYDEVLETYITYDVATIEIWDERGWHEFGEEWNKSYRMIAVVAPDSLSEKIKSITGDRIEVLNEKYLQYLNYSLSRNPLSNRVKHLENSLDKELLFANWEYTAITQKFPDTTASDSASHSYLLGKGIDDNVIKLYILSLIEKGRYHEVSSFLEQYRRKKGLDHSLTALLAGSYIKTGNRPKAMELLLESRNYKDLDLSVVEFLLKQTDLQHLAHINLQIIHRIFSEMAQGLLDGSSANLAYSQWRQYNNSKTENLNQSLKLIYSYLNNWDPFDAVAAGDLVTALKQKNFSQEEAWDKTLWDDRLKRVSSKLLSNSPYITY